MPRLPIIKTYKLLINGQFPRSESGRTLPVAGPNGAVIAHVCHASRKDLRDAVEAARGCQSWAAATGYLRGQVLYRMAEMLEGKAKDFAGLIAATSAPRGARRARSAATTPRGEVEASIDRLVSFAGWADKFAHVLGCQNPVAGPYYNFTTPEPTGVVSLVCPDEPSLLGLVSLLAPPLCAGNALVVLASQRHPLPAALFAEVCSTSDVPAGAINLLTGQRAELLEHLAQHREIAAIGAAGVSAKEAEVLRRGAASNLKRVHIASIGPTGWHDAGVLESPWTIEPYVEMKTIWQPCGP